MLMLMSNLFSIFDPSLSVFSSFWLMCLSPLVFLPGLYWLVSILGVFFSGVLSSVGEQVSYVLAQPKKGVYCFVGGVFLLISIYNFLALFPFLFSVTSHLLVTFPFAYSFWLGIIIFSWVSSMKHFLSHLIPLGTPFALISFMVLVELLSNFIRPLALTFRLTANMMAGHLLMSLVAGFLLLMPIPYLMLFSSVQILLVVMELGVSLIQAYVFTTLLLLYISESDS